MMDTAWPAAPIAHSRRQPSVGFAEICNSRTWQQRQCAADVAGDPLNAAEHDGTPHSIVTPFHSSAVPRLSLAAYARHVANDTGYGAEGLAVGLALMARYDRAAAAAPKDTTHAAIITTCFPFANNIINS